MDTPTLVALALVVAIGAPLTGVLLIGTRVLLGTSPLSEPWVARVTQGALLVSIAAAVVVAAGFVGVWAPPVTGEIDYGAWLELRDFRIPAVLMVDRVSVTIALFAAVLTSLVARFSRTYLHKEPGFTRFFALLGLFATGTQLVALAGALELFFAGWELIGIASAFFIGFFHERAEPVRSSIRAFATYRFSDAGLLLATVATFELLGSTRFSALPSAAALAPLPATIVALLFLLSAMGKSAQLPFSGWLPRAMEGPTPSSALFYGAVSIHAGLFLLLRVWPILAVAPAARTAAVVVGLSTAWYAALVVRVHTDAKGALAHATLAQVGLIVAEIGMGWTDLALIHLVCHAFLRLGQYLKAPNMIHEAHRLDLHPAAPTWLARRMPRLHVRLYAAALHRLRLDDRIDALVAPLLRLARALAGLDRRLVPPAPLTWRPAGATMSGPSASSAPAWAARGVAWFAIVGPLAVALRTSSASTAYAVVAVATVIPALQAWRATRVGGGMLLLAGGCTAAAGALAWTGSIGAAFGASTAALALRAGVIPWHAGTVALCERAPAIQRQQLAGMLALLLSHLRFVDHHAGAVAAAPWLVRYGAGACLLAAVITLAQRDLRGFYRGTTVMHGGMLLAAIGAASLGNFAAAMLVGVSMVGAVGGIGWLVDLLERRAGSRAFPGPHGLAGAFPVLATGFALLGGAGVAMPGMAGFVADDLLLHSLWMESPGSTVVVILASAVLAVATLVAFTQTFLGPRMTSRAPDLTGSERLLTVVLLGALLMLGVAPGVLLHPADLFLATMPTR